MLVFGQSDVKISVTHYIKSAIRAYLRELFILFHLRQEVCNQLTSQTLIIILRASVMVSLNIVQNN